ncbi:MAG TPA: HEAT repeat domain-containing protein [Azospirillaceae bacterium]|nr:HEAT repeat domain-containing protein [Azospirillaceae bacterium]
MLKALWLTSLLLAALAVAGMLSLVVRRIVLDRLEVKRQKRRKRLMQRVIAAVEGDETEGPAALAAALRASGADLAADILFDLSLIVRGQTMDRLIVVAHDLGVVAAMLRRLSNGRSRSQVVAARFLARFGGTEAVPALKRAARDAKPEVRLAATEALIELDAIDDVAAMVRDLRLQDLHNTEAASRLFRKLPATLSGQITSLAAGADDVRVRLLALEALGAGGSYEALPVILDATTHPAIDVRCEAFRALAILGHPAAAAAIGTGLDDPAWEVRTAAGQCAGRIGLTAMIPELARLLDDEHWWVRYRSAEALMALGAGGREVLRAVERQPSRAGRIAQAMLAQAEMAP